MSEVLAVTGLTRSFTQGEVKIEVLCGVDLAIGSGEIVALLGEARAASLALFDRLQLEAVLRVCRKSRSLSDAGRQLFQASRAQRSVVNDADRLRKYLAKFGLEWGTMTSA